MNLVSKRFPELHAPVSLPPLFSKTDMKPSIIYHKYDVCNCTSIERCNVFCLEVRKVEVIHAVSSIDGEHQHVSAGSEAGRHGG